MCTALADGKKLNNQPFSTYWKTKQLVCAKVWIWTLILRLFVKGSSWHLLKPGSHCSFCDLSFRQCAPVFSCKHETQINFSPPFHT